MCILVWLPRCLHWPFCPGVFIAALAFVAASMTFFRKDPGPRERAAWTFLFLMLMCAEVWTMSKDREATEQRQDKTDADQLKNFKEVANGIGKAIDSSQRQFDATMSGIRQNVNLVTGADDFGYLIFSTEQGIMTFVHEGEHVLYGVQVRIVDLNKWNQLGESGVTPQAMGSSQTIIPLGDFAPHMASPLNPVPFSDSQHQDFNIFFSARNGFWTELLRLRRLDGKWVEALKVFRTDKKGKPQKALLEKIDKNYPRDARGKVDWGN